MRLALAVVIAAALAGAAHADPARRAQELIDVARFDEAWDEVERGLAAAPDDRTLLTMRAMLDLLRDDPYRAVLDAARAIELGAPERDFDIIALVVAARERCGGRRSTLPAGSATRFVDEWIEALAAGRPASELARAFGPELWANATVKSRETAARVLAAEIALVREEEHANGLERGGWVVHPDARHTGEHVWVRVEVPTALAFTKELRRRFADGVDHDVAMMAIVDYDLRQTLHRIPPGAVARTLDGLVGKRFWGTTRYQVELSGTTGDWRITDILVEGMSYRTTLGEREALLVHATAAEQRTRRIGLIFLVIAAAGGLFVAFRRLRVHP